MSDVAAATERYRAALLKEQECRRARRDAERALYSASCALDEAEGEVEESRRGLDDCLLVRPDRSITIVCQSNFRDETPSAHQEKVRQLVEKATS